MANQSPITQIVPSNQTPSHEALGSHSRYMSELFPTGYLYNLGAKLLDYNEKPPEFGSPLLPLYRSLKFSKDELTKQSHASIDTGEFDRETIESDLIAVTVQMKLASFINNAYFTLTGEGALPLQAIDKISDYIDDRDQWLFEKHHANIDRYTLELAKLERGDDIPILPDLGGWEVDSAFYRSRDPRYRGLKSMPITPELQREAYRQRQIAALKKERLNQQRSRFDWISSVVIIEALKEGTRIEDI